MRRNLERRFLKSWRACIWVILLHAITNLLTLYRADEAMGFDFALIPLYGVYLWFRRLLNARHKDDLLFQGRVGPGCLWGGDAEGKQEQQILLRKCNCQLDLAQITSIPDKDNFLSILKSYVWAAFSPCEVYFVPWKLLVYSFNFLRTTIWGSQ